mmetsp:Transcript_79336/g.190422  ORF Transcript_79336/g.190422 Transcript_79336/m.190422 type:complete len:281 (+) Transcript_79336:1511-2353(+)
MLCRLNKTANASRRADRIRVQDHGVVISVVCIPAVLRYEHDVLTASQLQVLAGGIELLGLAVVLHVSFEAKARASELPPESAIVFVEVGEGLVAARGGQDHEILVLARLLQDLAVPVQIQEVPCRIRNSEVQILRKGLHAAPRVRPVRLQTLQPVLGSMTGSLAHRLQGAADAAQPQGRVTLLQGLGEGLEQRVDFRRQNRRDFLSALVSAVHLTAHDGERRGHGDHSRGDAGLWVQVGQVGRQGGPECVLRRLLLFREQAVGQDGAASLGQTFAKILAR